MWTLKSYNYIDFNFYSQFTRNKRLRGFSMEQKRSSNKIVQVVKKFLIILNLPVINITILQ